ncbi:hypothetical protein Mapa_000887 [Marchantia paleacea]|nr:hypothetical protein Mapa_000887 [Marchantia paleacea]
MGSRSVWNIRTSIVRYSQKRLRTFSCRGKKGGCIHTGDLSAEHSGEFQPSKRSVQSKPTTSNSLEGNSSSTSPPAAPAPAARLSPTRDDETGFQASSESPAATNIFGNGNSTSSFDTPETLTHREPEARAKDSTKDQEAQQVPEFKSLLQIAAEPKKGIILKAVISTIHDSEITSDSGLQTDGQPMITEAAAADEDEPMQEGRYSHTLAPEPKKGILKPGISVVYESDVPCDHRAETHACGDCSGSAEAQQRNHCGETAAVNTEAPRSSCDSGRTFSLISVPKSRAVSPLTQPGPKYQLAGIAGAVTSQVKPCSQCQNTYDLGKPARLLKAECIKQVTNNFCKKNFLDNGESEFVYKGCLEGQQVAVKTIRHEDSGDKFLAEITVLTCLQHPNIVSLVGYCLEENDRALVYNYACNRSLHWHLCCLANGTKLMEWTIRKNMAIYLAKALHYLHSECKYGGIIHGDFRTKNIFLNHDMVPVIGGFAQSRWQEGGSNSLNNRWPKGPWYVAPEYLEGGQISEKVDVYAFGIVMLELITGRSAADRSQRHRFDMARPWLESTVAPDFETVKKEILDAHLMKNGQDLSETDVVTTIHAVRLCLTKDPNLRPRMSQVLDMLENSDHGDLQDRSSPNSSLAPSTVVRMKEFELPLTINRSSQSAALATLRAADPAETRNTDNNLMRPPDDGLGSPEYRSPPSTPTHIHMFVPNSEYSSTECNGRGSRTIRTESVIHLLYRPLNNLASSSNNKPRHRVTFSKYNPTRIDMDDCRRACKLLKKMLELFNLSSRRVVMLLHDLKSLGGRPSTALHLLSLEKYQ